jgi:serine/threonine-protein kinase
MSSVMNDNGGAPHSHTEGREQPGSRRDPLVGRTIAGRFRVLNVIARGGMGKVYRAEQAPLGRVCALKVLSPKYSDEEDPEFQRRFYLEAATAAKLSHPNTVTIYDYGRDGDIYFIAMEYVQGRTLYRVLREEGPQSEAHVAYIVRQVARSLREAHAHGVIHRDMKPANVVITDRGAEGEGVKVLDFGLVKDVTRDDVEDLTQEGMFMGSPKYMSPEQILGHPVSARSDIYALGVVAYELLTGRVPFDAGASVKTLMAHVNDSVPALRLANPDVELSPTMEAIVMRCLEKHPENRFRDMDELLQALSALPPDTARARRITEPPSLPGGQRHDVARSGTYPNAQIAPPLPVPEPPPSFSRPLTPAYLEDDAVATPQRGLVARGSPLTKTPLSGEPPPALVTSEPPSATPAPLALVDVEVQRPRGRGRTVLVAVVGLALVAVVAVAATGGFSGDSAVTQAAPPADAPPTQGEQQPTNPTPAAAPAGAKRVVEITTKPSGAKVVEDGAVVCASTPCKIEWEGEAASRRHELEVSKAGYRSQTVTVNEDATAAAATLAPLARGAVPSRPRPTAKTGAAPAPQPAAPSGYKDSPY